MTDQICRQAGSCAQAPNECPHVRSEQSGAIARGEQRALKKPRPFDRGLSYYSQRLIELLLGAPFLLARGAAPAGLFGCPAEL